MLVLTRRYSEGIMIGEDIEIRILDIQNNQVKIGIVAPKDVLILREELRNQEKDDDDAI